MQVEFSRKVTSRRSCNPVTKMITNNVTRLYCLPLGHLGSLI
jgi:hypothetical protein